MQNALEQGKVFAVPRMNEPVKSIVPTLLRALSVVIIFFGGMFSWLFKDGLGPDSVSSVGFVSFTQFLVAFWPFGIVAFILAVVSFLVPRTYTRNASSQRT